MITFLGLVGFALLLTIGVMMFLPIAAATILFSQPVDCQLGQDCFIQNYVDQDASEAAKDYRCGHMSYDGHKGTDYRLRNLKATQEGVKVLAAAKGTVARLRDGMNDVNMNDESADVEGRECGNGIVIKHRGGFETQYCHMKQGSLLVEEGDQVERYQPIGEIGMSGKTEFPHLHFQITNKDGDIIDPFYGKRYAKECGNEEFETIWAAKSKPAAIYRDTIVLDHGFYKRAVTKDEIATGEMQIADLSKNADALVFWANLIGVKQGDVLLMQLVGPEKETLVNHAKPFTRNQAQFFQFIGKKLAREGAWPAGEYRALVQVQRNKQIVVEKHASIKVIESEIPESDASGLPIPKNTQQ